jgi:hypothetical protein
MRLSLMKGAPAELSCTAWQEIGVKPFFGLSGIHSIHLTVLSATSQFPMNAPPSAWMEVMDRITTTA